MCSSPRENFRHEKPQGACRDSEVSAAIVSSIFCRQIARYARVSSLERPGLSVGPLKPMGPALLEPFQHAIDRTPERRKIFGEQHETERQHPKPEYRQEC